MLILSGRQSFIFVNQLNATKLKSSKSQFKFQFELSLAQLSSSLFKLILIAVFSVRKKYNPFRFVHKLSNENQ